MRSSTTLLRDSRAIIPECLFTAQGISQLIKFTRKERKSESSWSLVRPDAFAAKDLFPFDGVNIVSTLLPRVGMSGSISSHNKWWKYRKKVHHCLSSRRTKRKSMSSPRQMFRTFTGEFFPPLMILCCCFIDFPFACSHLSHRFICQERWQEKQHEYYYSLVLMSLQFIIPLVVLVFTYARIAVAVWGNK